MKIRCFEDAIAWQKGQQLAVWVYQTFGQTKDFSFRDQICRAAVSVSNNFAEGFDRGSDRDFLKFLFIARGSNSEVKSMIHLALKLHIIDKNVHQNGIDQCEEVGKILNGFISALLKASNPTNRPTN